MHLKSEEKPVIIAQTGPLNGKKWMLGDEIAIGRDTTCEIVISDRQVSRRHATFTLTPEGILLTDLDSKNGTHHNGKRISEPVILQDGDIIQVALAQEFLYLSAEATVPLNQPGTQPPTKKLKLQKKSRRVWVGTTEILPPLSVAQFRLLELLYEQEGKVIPRETITTGIWGEKGILDISNQALDALIRRLRDRLAEADAAHTYIVTIRGHGLRLDNPAET